MRLRGSFAPRQRQSQPPHRVHDGFFIFLLKLPIALALPSLKS
ncbi:hypothetical protein CEV31_3412 [Brucella thiophenivorans]|uniref:Uncharacterized protein n=1 Tax=Brucella thiophenivorans TaxID=571255 RepID=A0A256FEV7_9HYPH|nr:hypothetical protein CEV31_3412 [Brucella thiophenivorans]